MIWPIVSSLALLLASSGTLNELPTPQVAAARAAFQEYDSSYDSRAESELLDLANRARAKDDLPPFKMDPDLVKAARDHATAMAQHQQLSHQFSGEPELGHRLAAASSLFLQEAAENVAMADSVDRVHESLMHSPPHRENLLHPSYNVVGFGVVRKGRMLYVVQDFGHSLPNPSAQSSGDMLAMTINRMRDEKSLPALERRESPLLQSGACAMGKNNSIHAPAGEEPPQGRYVLRYNTAQPDSVPSQAGKAINDRSVTAFSSGVCFARSSSYPNGIYWTLLVFY
ncbi:MAG TPA: CAP domain-containing protein [Terriglobales bacterium]|jgi:uncharacterized protein YkwD|nr:CAP domain-containing protein [Terriglobales bacterium]